MKTRLGPLNRTQMAERLLVAEALRSLLALGAAVTVTHHTGFVWVRVQVGTDFDRTLSGDGIRSALVNALLAVRPGRQEAA